VARIEYAGSGSPEAERVAEVVRSQRGGRFPHLYQMLVHSPVVAEAWLRLGTAVRYQSEVDEATRELVICLVARMTRAEYEWRPHRRLAVEQGFSEAQIDGILDWRSGEFGEKHAAVLALAEGLTRDVEVDDEVFDALREHLTSRQLVELVATVAYYNMLGRFLAGLQIDLET
jgi:alkylhydroperoxidase family enzyme